MGPRLTRRRAYFRNFTVLEEQNYVITFTCGILDPGNFARGIQDSGL